MRGGFFISPGRLPLMPGTDRTDVASALRLAMAMFPHDTAKRVVLMSDGNDNMGDVLAEARRGGRLVDLDVDEAPETPLGLLRGSRNKEAHAKARDDARTRKGAGSCRYYGGHPSEGCIAPIVETQTRRDDHEQAYTDEPT